jgi:hypothetical protein
VAIEALVVLADITAVVVEMVLQIWAHLQIQPHLYIDLVSTHWPALEIVLLIKNLHIFSM